MSKSAAPKPVETPPAPTEVQPQAGGSYLRLPDGSLVPNDAPPANTPAHPE